MTNNFSCGPIAAVCGELVHFFVESEPAAGYRKPKAERGKRKESRGQHPIGTTEKPHKVQQADPLCLQREGTCRESSTVRTIPRYTVDLEAPNVKPPPDGCLAMTESERQESILEDFRNRENDARAMHCLCCVTMENAGPGKMLLDTSRC